MANADKLSDTRSLLQAVFDVADQAITVTGSVTTTPPVGASTEAKQDDQILLETDIKTAVESIDTKVATAAKQPALGTAGTASADVITVQGIASMTALVVDGSAVTQPVSAAALPLPTGAATSADQATANASLSSIDGKVPANLTVTSTRLLVDGSGVTQPVSNANLTSIDSKLSLLVVVDLLDGGLIQGSTIAGSGGAFKEVIASTAATVKQIQIFDTTGDFLGWYTGGSGSEVLAFITGPGTNESLPVSIASGTRLSVRGLEASVSGAGAIAANLLG